MISIINDNSSYVGRLGVSVYIGGSNCLSSYGNHVAIWTVACLEVCTDGVVHRPFLFSLRLFVLLLYCCLLLPFSFWRWLTQGHILYEVYALVRACWSPQPDILHQQYLNGGCSSPLLPPPPLFWLLAMWLYYFIMHIKLSTLSNLMWCIVCRGCCNAVLLMLYLLF